jgi:hypothetical protein
MIVEPPLCGPDILSPAEPCPEGLIWTAAQKGAELILKPTHAFAEFFPPRQVILEQESQSAYLDGQSELAPRREQVAMESVLLILAMKNPAFKPFRALYDDAQLRKAAPYRGSLTPCFLRLSRR